MSAVDDIQFLAKLVHRGQLDKEHAKRIMPALEQGAALDELLADVLDWDEEEIARLRRTDAGEIPEIPGYEVLGRLGAGGTADVWRVREQRTGKVVALKVLKAASQADEPTLSAFKREAKMLKALSHPGLVSCQRIVRYELARGSGRFAYFSQLECINGATLQEILDEGRPFQESEAMQVVLEVAEVLKYLATQKIVHRDVKPGNVMFTADRSVKLIDLGFAAEDGSAAQSADTATGTPEYLSPEQARGGAAADERSDIYSLGVTLFQLVVGRLPFEQADNQDLLRAHIEEQFQSPELKSAGFTPHLPYFIRKMMAKEMEERYQGFEELIAGVKEMIEGYEDLNYGRPSPKGPVRRPRRR
jgi:serine/threonine-protein kinase